MTPLSNQLAMEREMNPQKRYEHNKKYNTCKVNELILLSKNKKLIPAFDSNNWPIFDPAQNAFLTCYRHSYSKDSVRYSEWKFVWLKVGAETLPPGSSRHQLHDIA